MQAQGAFSSQEQKQDQHHQHHGIAQNWFTLVEAVMSRECRRSSDLHAGGMLADLKSSSNLLQPPRHRVALLPLKLVDQ